MTAEESLNLFGNIYTCKGEILDPRLMREGFVDGKVAYWYYEASLDKTILFTLDGVTVIERPTK